MNKRCFIITTIADANTIKNAGIQSGDMVICADGGYDAALSVGLDPDIVIGDMDSCINTPDAGLELIKLQQEKDETDTFAATKLALERGADEIIILGGLYGRFDHSVAILQTLSFLSDSGCACSIMDRDNLAMMISGGDSITLDPGLLFADNQNSDGQGTDYSKLDGQKNNLKRYFSVYSYTERCERVTITGAKYPLRSALLTQSFPLGTSNEFLSDIKAEISLEKGKLLVVITEE